MAKEKFVYNKHTLRYEVVEVTPKERILRLLGFTSAVVFTGILFTLTVWKLFPSPNEEAKTVEIIKLQEQLKAKESQIIGFDQTLAKIQERDRGIHRMILGMDPIDENIWNGGVGGSPRYDEFVNLSTSGDLMAAVQQKADKLKWRLAKQSESFDAIAVAAMKKEERFAAIPSIKPVRSDKLKRNIKLLSGFGMRIHPIHKVRKMHAGIDFTAPRGTAIQATGDGTIVRVQKIRTGYGHNVTIDHGFGYKTLYGHMSRIDVKKGQKVKKGEKIGLVGSTGGSTAPHLHYEVIHNGRKVNPIDYCLDGLSPTEYDELKKLAETANQSLD